MYYAFIFFSLHSYISVHVYYIIWSLFTCENLFWNPKLYLLFKFIDVYSALKLSQNPHFLYKCKHNQASRQIHEGIVLTRTHPSHLYIVQIFFPLRLWLVYLFPFQNRCLILYILYLGWNNQYYSYCITFTGLWTRTKVQTTKIFISTRTRTFG